MLNEYLKKALQLNSGKEPYATATIVRRKIPSSGKPGDKAIITSDGKIHGWIGGGCTRGIVLKESLLAIQEAKPRFIQISPNVADEYSSFSKVYNMTCQSGGEVDIYIEPVLPRPHIYIFGVSHIAMALSKIALAMNYSVSCVGEHSDKTIFEGVQSFLSHEEYTKHNTKQNNYVVVCTQGEGDAEALYSALVNDPKYISFVASRKKANSIFREVREKGITFDQLKEVKTPAGLDIKAKLPEEVAISILAEIINHLRDLKDSSESTQQIVIDNEDFYLNPVCKIPIQKSTAKHVLEYKNEKIYFCCDGCKVSFEKTPEMYIESV